MIDFFTLAGLAVAVHQATKHVLLKVAFKGEPKRVPIELLMRQHPMLKANPTSFIVHRTKSDDKQRDFYSIKLSDHAPQFDNQFWVHNYKHKTHINSVLAEPVLNYLLNDFEINQDYLIRDLLQCQALLLQQQPIGPVISKWSVKDDVIVCSVDELPQMQLQDKFVIKSPQGYLKSILGDCRIDINSLQSDDVRVNTMIAECCRCGFETKDYYRLKRLVSQIEI